ncbi:hypothetical protein RHMOL_Rhmol02G0120500 [Rhododendron molle]|uniref:Uncharacterized protein n=1 Tax=Rhododendron molle TaxID=49168 RepID=A0ACC0PPJ1_RHOML|nr:hypothetical protein RHMOL_Rhmol02G0120500 [Rhododendron molle]
MGFWFLFYRDSGALSDLLAFDCKTDIDAANEEGIVRGGGCTILRLVSKVDAIKDNHENDEEKAGRTLSVRKWQAAFIPDGYLDIGRTLSRMRHGVVYGYGRIIFLKREERVLASNQKANIPDLQV